MKEIQYFSDGEQATAAVLNRPLQDLNKQGQYISKAQFEANADINRKAYAGSGFIKLGPPKWSASAIGSLATDDKYPNSIFWGTNAEGDYYNINGISQYIHDVNKEGASNIKLPEVPTSLGTITDSSDIGILKQSDFLNLARFDELISYAKYYSKDRISSYTYNNGDDTLTIEDDTDSENGYVSLRLSCIYGAEYTISITADKDMVFDSGYHNHLNIDGHATYISGETVAGNEYTVTLIGGLNTRVVLYSSDTTVTYTMSIKQYKETPIVAIKPITGGDIYDSYSNFIATDSISRQDLVFLETWHEDVSEKDIVYPYGNIQYRGGNTDGLSNIGEGTFAGKETYSLFGNWQSENDLVGLGYKWSDLSNEDKLKFAGNKENNIYKDGDNIVQVRYRVRVVKGLGNNWNIFGKYSHDKFLSPDIGLTNKITLRCQGSGVTSNTSTYYGDGGYYTLDSDEENVPESNEGVPSLFIDDNSSYNMPGFGLPIALVQRRNDGAFDPVHNPEGSGTFTDGKEWFETSDSHNNLTDCFNNKANGYIGTVSGRPDGLFVDEVNERDVEDLRMSALKRPYKEILDEYHNKMVKNELRGKTKSLKIIKLENRIYEQTASISFQNDANGLVYCPQLSNIFPTALGGYIIINNIYLKLIPNNRHTSSDYYKLKGLQTLDGEIVTASVLENILGEPKIAQAARYYTFNNIEVYAVTTSSYTENKISTHCDIIGDPRKLSDRVKYTVVDGTSQTVDLLKNDYVLNDDGHIYRALIARDSIDLDTDDYTNTDNWIDLGADGSVGGYPEEWFKGHIGTPNIITNEGYNALPLDHEVRELGCISISLSKKIKDLVSSIYILPSKVIFTNTRTNDTYEIPNLLSFQIVSTENVFGTYGFYSGNTLYLRPNQNDYEDIDFWVFEVFYETHADVLTPSYSLNETLEIQKDVYTGARYKYRLGGKIADDLLCQPSKSESAGYDYYSMGQLYSYRTEPWNNNNFDSSLHAVRHTGDISEIPSNVGSNVKYSAFLKNNNGICEITYLFKEMKYTDGSWGDDNRFRIDYYTATKEDDNGQMVAYGQKAIRLPYFSNK